MPRSIALVAAVAAVLATAACGAAEPGSTTSAGDQPSPQTHQAGPSESGAAAPTDTGADATPTDAGPADPAPEGSELQAGAADSSALRTGTLDASLRTNPGAPGLPAGSGASVDDVLRLGAVAAWVDAPRTFSVSLPASGDCWPAAGEPMAMSEREVTVAYTMPALCEQPDAARTYVFEMPAGIDTGAPLEIRIEGLPYRFTLPLPAA